MSQCLVKYITFVALKYFIGMFVAVAGACVVVEAVVDAVVDVVLMLWLKWSLMS